MRPVEWIARLADRAGYQIHRLDAARRTELLRHHQIDLVLDVGAAVGKYGQDLRRFGYAGEIVSFEPLDTAYAALESAARGDGRWQTVKTAVGDTNSEDTIHIAGNSDSSSLLNMLNKHIDVAPGSRYVRSQRVRVQRLDDLSREWIDKSGAPYLKIDTQGYERSVLDGASGIIDSVRGIQIELTFEPLYEGGMMFDEAINRLLADGFQLQGLEPGFRDSSTQQLLQADGIFFRTRT